MFNINTKIKNFLHGTKFVLMLGLIVLSMSCAKKSEVQQGSGFESLEQKALACIEKNNRSDAVDCLEQIVAKHAERSDISKYKLLLAENYFKTSRYPAAYEMFEHFHQYYPSDEKAEYAKYKSVLAKYYQTLRHDCDQTATEGAVSLCKQYLNIASYQTFRRDVEDIKMTCTQKLIDKEIYVFDFYLKQKEYAAAKKRIDYLRAQYIKSYPALEPRLMYLECKLAKRQKNNELMADTYEKLAQKYPESQYASMGQALLAKNSFFF